MFVYGRVDSAGGGGGKLVTIIIKPDGWARHDMT